KESAKWNGASVSALGGDGAGGGSFNATLIALAVNGSDVYAAGYFFSLNNNGTVIGHAPHIAHWNGANWSALGVAQGPINKLVYALAVDGTDVYVGGAFQDLSNHGVSI